MAMSSIEVGLKNSYFPLIHYARLPAVVREMSPRSFPELSSLRGTWTAFEKAAEIEPTNYFDCQAVSDSFLLDSLLSDSLSSDSSIS